MSAVSDPAPIAHAAIHHTVVDLLRTLPRGRVLDVPAGEGALAARLAREGFTVRCCDLYPQIFKLDGVEIRQGDLSGRLPYADAEFDIVTCLEGLEHIENPHQAIREFARVLAPGGHVVISVPNILNIEERVKWLLHGYTSHFKPLSRAHLTARRAQTGGREEIVLHVNPIGYAELRYALEREGFAIQRVLRDKAKRRQWLYWPLTILIRAIGRATPAPKRRERWTDELQSDPVLLGGNTLIVHAVRTGSRDKDHEAVRIS